MQPWQLLLGLDEVVEPLLLASDVATGVTVVVLEVPLRCQAGSTAVLGGSMLSPTQATNPAEVSPQWKKPSVNVDVFVALR